jgi:transposase-like protein
VSNRQTAIGRLFRSDPTRARAEIVAALETYGGNVTRAALELGVTRRQLTRWIGRERLWLEVSEARSERREKAKPEWWRATQESIGDGAK